MASPFKIGELVFSLEYDKVVEVLDVGVDPKTAEEIIKVDGEEDWDFACNYHALDDREAPPRNYKEMKQKFPSSILLKELEDEIKGIFRSRPTDDSPSFLKGMSIEEFYKYRKKDL